MLPSTQKKARKTQLGLCVDLITMDSDETKGSSLLAKGPHTEVETKVPYLQERVVMKQRLIVEEQQQAHGGRNRSHGKVTRSLVGGTFLTSDVSCEDDNMSVDSISLHGVNFVPSQSDQSVTTRSSLPMEYSEDEQSERVNRYMEPNIRTSLLGDFKIGAGSSRNSHVFMERDFDSDSDSILTSSTTDHGSSSDAYFSQEPISPPKSLLETTFRVDVGNEEDIFQLDHLEYGSIVGSSDTDHVYEDEDESSNNFAEEPFVEHQEATSVGSCNRFSKNYQTHQIITENAKNYASTSALDWSSYNQERGRYLAQCLIAKARKQNLGSSTTPITPKTLPSLIDDLSPDEDDGKHLKKKLTFRSLFSRRPYRSLAKRLDDDYQLVDATIDVISNASHGNTTSLAENLPQSLNLRHRTSSRTSSSSDSVKEDDKVDNMDALDQYTPCVLSSATPGDFHLSKGLDHRVSVNEIIDQLNLGSQALSAIQELREYNDSHSDQNRITNVINLSTSMACQCDTAISMYEMCLACDGEITRCRMMISIQQIPIPDYQVRVQWFVSRYHQHLLEKSDRPCTTTVAM